MTKDEFISQTITRSMFGLEVGPSFNPYFPRSDGWNVETVDHASADDLRKKYADLEDISKIEEVNYVSDARPLHETIYRRGEYDFIFASHVVEHLTDLIGFIKSCEILLKPSGRLVLVVPDKRRCFDVMQARTTTGDVLDAYRIGSTRHTPGSVFDFFANIADMGGHTIWEHDWARKFELGFHFATDVQEAKQRYDYVAANDDYLDIHRWNFVPSSFRLIMQDLEKTGLINLREDFFSDTSRCEFYFSASPNGPGCPLSRLDLHRAIAWEEIEGNMQIISGKPQLI